MRHLTRYARRPVTVVIASGMEVTTFAGTLSAITKGGLELDDVALVAEHDPTIRQALEGRVWIPAAQIISVQIRGE